MKTFNYNPCNNSENIMATRVILYPYNMGSNSAKALQEKLVDLGIRTKRVHPDGTYRPFDSHKIINWGNSNPPTSWNCPDNILNKPYNVAIASNKLSTFNALREASINTPKYTSSKGEAQEWIEEDGVVLCRTKLNGHSGEGIVIARVIEDLVDSPLYVLYKKKRSEYRVHVFKGTVLSVQEKRRDTEVERDQDQALIRSHDNGWVFCRENVTEDVRLRDIATQAIKTLGLDFGAVDIIYNQREDTYYVLEINTAPGLTGQTLEEYVHAISNHYNNNN
jgi:hypothetical protein